MATLVLPAATIRKISIGKKTQHRHPASYDARFAIYRPCAFKVGEPHPIQIGRAPGDEPVEHIEVTSPPTVHTLAELTLLDAMAEGHRTTLDFQRDWLTRHHADNAADFEDDEVAHLFAKRASTPVWVLHIKITDADRFLTANPDGVQAHYTFNGVLGIRGEGPAVKDAQQRKITADAHKIRDAGLSAEWERQRQRVQLAVATLERELATVSAGFDHRRVNKRMRAMKNQLAAIDDELRNAA
jgi:50S ribosomal subunit-associated GTPase HflX